MAKLTFYVRSSHQIYDNLQRYARGTLKIVKISSRLDSVIRTILVHDPDGPWVLEGSLVLACQLLGHQHAPAGFPNLRYFGYGDRYIIGDVDDDEALLLYHLRSAIPQKVVTTGDQSMIFVAARYIGTSKGWLLSHEKPLIGDNAKNADIAKQLTDLLSRNALASEAADVAFGIDNQDRDQLHHQQIRKADVGGVLDRIPLFKRIYDTAKPPPPERYVPGMFLISAADVLRRFNAEIREFTQTLMEYLADCKHHEFQRVYGPWVTLKPADFRTVRFWSGVASSTLGLRRPLCLGDFWTCNCDAPERTAIVASVREEINEQITEKHRALVRLRERTEAGGFTNDGLRELISDYREVENQ
jgi:hypothetical protein